MATPYVTEAQHYIRHNIPTKGYLLKWLLPSWDLAHNQGTPCDGAAHGYFTGDSLDTLPEPLLYRGPISASSITPSSSPISHAVSRPTG